MRLICPNCAAQYEIDASLLPDEGREVQCSACGHVWFQTADSKPEVTEQPTPAPEATQDPGTNPANDLPETDENSEETASALDSAPAQPPRKPVDDEVLGILRDEAAFEAEARAREAEGLESQPELGLGAAAPWPRSDPPEAEPETDGQDRTETGRASTRSSFPDIEDISSTLSPVGAARKTAESETELPATADARKRSFLGGFLLPIALALILLAVYLAAPQLSELVPALAEPLAGYVDLVDAARAAVADLLGR